nr:SulP family inorganic anion transporter [Psychrobacter sp. I-STPA6b]
MVPNWVRTYAPESLPTDIIAGLVVGILVIPQSLGYAVLAGLPPVYGLYAAILPVLVYAWVGASNIQAVGPVAITAIMTASSLHPYVDNTEQYAMMASLLALMVGGMLWLAGRLNLGWIVQFISRGVSAGFVSGAAILIFFSQLKYITGTAISGNTLLQYFSSLKQHITTVNLPTLLIGSGALLLFILNRYASSIIWASWLSPAYAKWVGRLFPLLLVIIAIIASTSGHWTDYGIQVIGTVPSGFPSFHLPILPSVHDMLQLLPTAALMALIAFVSSSSVASTYARLRGERFDANDELKGLGLANIAGGFFQSFPVAGGFSRTAINVDSGAQTPLASIVTVLVMVATLLVLGALIAPLPYALLGAMIMASILSLVDISTLRAAWQHDRLDALSFLSAFFGVLIFGLNTGLVLGLMVSFASLIWQSSQPHIAVVGQLAGTEHFRNVHRHDVITYQNLLIMRIDESLFFGNSESVHQQIQAAINNHPNANELILIMAAVNHIDLTAQEMLITLNRELVDMGWRLHFSFIKGPVMDVIEHTPIIQQLSGQVFMSTIKAVQTLTYPTTTKASSSP